MSEDNAKNKNENSRNGVTTTRPRAQTVNLMEFAKAAKAIDTLMPLQNPTRSASKTFTQYTKDLVKQYLQNPNTNIENLREVSRFLSRVSMLYKKFLSYYASIPMWNYNISRQFDFTQPETQQEILVDYQSCLKFMHSIDMQKEFPNVVATALRDGVYFGFVYQLTDDHFFFHNLNPKYCKIIGKNVEGQWVVAFDATFFDVGTNSIFVNKDENPEGTWDQVFVDGYEAYQKDKSNARWFVLPAEKVLCVLAGWDDEYDLPLPYFTPIFTSLLDLLDLEQIIMSKTELENYALLLSKIPLLSGSENVDDFAVSLDLAQQMQALIDAVVPEQVGTAYSPFDVDVVTFEKSNNTDDTDKLSQAMSNLFSNAGLSEPVISSGATNSVGLKYSVQNDETMAFMYMDRIQSWLRFFMKANGFEDYIFTFHRQSYFNKDDFAQHTKEFATLGGSAMDYYTSRNMTPFEAYNKILTEQALDIKAKMKPLQSSYTMSSSSSDGGAPEKAVEDLTEEGLDTREANKNAK